MTSAPSAGRLLVNRYSLIEVIGQGPASVVWKASDEQSGEEVAVKEIDRPGGLDPVESEVILKKMLRDGRQVAAFSHPGAVPVHDVFEESGSLYVVMDVFGGPTLADVVHERGPLPPERAAEVGAQLLETLEAAHAAGILHRGVGPSNVVLPDGGRAQLSDFAVSGSLIPGPDRVLSPYSAPEQTPTTGASPAADIWSLGATLRFSVEGGLRPAGRTNDDEPSEPGSLDSVLDSFLAAEAGARPEAGHARRLLEAVAQGDTEAVVAVSDDSETGSDGNGDGGPSGTVTEPQPKVTREPWFFPVPVDVVPGSELGLLEVEPDRPPPPPPRGMSKWRIVGITVMTVGLTFFMLILLSTRAGRRVHLGGTQTTVVPHNWFGYTDPQTGFSVSRPPDWQVAELGTATDFRDPKTGAFFRVETVAALDASPQETWKRLEQAFSGHTADYERVRLVPTKFQSRPASIWEYRYRENGKEIQVVQLGFFAGNRPMVLRFQADADEWERYQPDLAAFEASFRTPR